MTTKTMLVLALSLATSCTPRARIEENARTSEDYRARVRAESLEVARSGDTVYQRRMRELWRRIGLVQTDSLARLEVAMSNGPESTRVHVRDALSCELDRVIVTHGQAP